MDIVWLATGSLCNNVLHFVLFPSAESRATYADGGVIRRLSCIVRQRASQATVATFSIRKDLEATEAKGAWA
eukprot:3954967-Amphidinium_carterae.2